MSLQHLARVVGYTSDLRKALEALSTGNCEIVLICDEHEEPLTEINVLTRSELMDEVLWRLGEEHSRIYAKGGLILLYDNPSSFSDILFKLGVASENLIRLE